jgi:5'-deoxynucleotidase YfbR-like HD superfamily hydrolase
VADHSFTTATMSYIIAKELKLDLDYEKLLKMALFHEIGEIKGGDLVVFKNRDVTEAEK